LLTASEKETRTLAFDCSPFGWVQFVKKIENEAIRMAETNDARRGATVFFKEANLNFMITYEFGY